MHLFIQAHTPIGQRSRTRAARQRDLPLDPPIKVRQPSATAPRVLIAGVGYRNLRDMSLGPVLVERLQARDWPPNVQLEDLSFGAIHAVHWFQQTQPFDGAIFLGAVARGRLPGAIERRRWQAPRLGTDEVQTRVAEAVTGVIGLDTLLIVLGQFGALPPCAIAIEVEPRDDNWGEAFSPVVERAMEEMERLIAAEVEALVAA